MSLIVTNAMALAYPETPRQVVRAAAALAHSLRGIVGLAFTITVPLGKAG